jgi:hypothetical protein
MPSSSAMRCKAHCGSIQLLNCNAICEAKPGGKQGAPGAMPLSAGSSGWWAAVMPATCVPWLPASTTAGQESRRSSRCGKAADPAAAR